MLRVLDKTGTHTIQKVSHTTKRGLRVHYQTIETAMIGKGGQAKVFATLGEARQDVGKTPIAPDKETAPARSYAEQNKGYSKK